ncbi:MAG: GtrA family protein [Propionibacteriaceae bacterium]|jgi:putative flippase GtrA|nr:GtrA family protein [Propionibacteriaceae bacterium]
MDQGKREHDFAGRHHLTLMQEIAKVVRFTSFELSAGLIQIILFTLLSEGLHANYELSYLSALIGSVAWSFTANRHFTFKSVSNLPLAMAKIALYYAIFTPVSTWIGGHLAAQHWGIHPSTQHYIILIGTMVVNFSTEFLVYRFFVYRKSINSSPAGQREQEHYAAVEERAEH